MAQIYVRAGSALGTAETPVRSRVPKTEQNRNRKKAALVREPGAGIGGPTIGRRSKVRDIRVSSKSIDRTKTGRRGPRTARDPTRVGIRPNLTVEREKS